MQRSAVSRSWWSLRSAPSTFFRPSPKKAAASALGAIGDPRAVGPLTRATKDARPAVANAAKEALASYLGESR